MSVQTKPERRTKAAVSVSEMCRLLSISRSQFYWHVKRGTFHEPLKLASNGRPYFTAEMVEQNLTARETGIGVDGEFVIFYERRSTSDVSRTATVRSAKRSVKAEPVAPSSPLADGLRSLGLDVTSDQIEAALIACYPTGTDGDEESNILRTVFRHLKRAGV
ncbi:helix-turn-helix transcriptional regulator [Thalassoroseus pseudoceratinae]|uniref:helix-turn-helix transcriptional regulator n=1 Tax=Thalassoroseus pseudoceratinae TaxID=2713176 RepID=UPI00197E2EEC|nr:hypothetical protein [Thalassoroseus pseudoceratinae]